MKPTDRPEGRFTEQIQETTPSTCQTSNNYMATLVTMETPVLSRLPPNSTVLTPVSTPPLSLSHQIGIAILVLAFVFGFPGNLFVVWSILCKVRRRSVTCLLILNLALADALVLLSAPLFLRFLAGGRGWEFGSAMCKTVHYLCCVNMYASIYLICLMSLDRWLAVTKPFLSQRMRTKKRLLLIMLGIWVMAFLMALPMPFYRSLLQIPSVPIYVCMPYHWKSVGHEIFQYISETLLGFLVPFTFILVCYISVICRLRSAMFQRKGRGSILILLIIGAFAVFWLPYHLINILQVIGLIQGSSSSLLKAAKVARPNVTAFAFLSSSINPVLYVFAGSSHIRQAGLCFMAKLFEATNSESTRSTRSSRGSNAESSVLNKLSIKLSHKRDDTRAETPGEGEGPTAEVYSRDEIKTLTTLQ